MLKTKDLVINILLSVSVILIILIAFEVTIRFIYGNHLTYEVDNELYWKLQPNQKGYQVIGFPKATINSQGFRGEEIKDKSFNIFMLGDSYTFGQGVEDKETFPHFLGKILSDVNKDIQVINLGTPGWGLFQENVTLYRHYGTYNPKVVVLTLLEGDFQRLKFDDKIKEAEYLKRAGIRTYFRELSSFSFLKQKIGFIFKTNFGATENYVGDNVDSKKLWPKNAIELDSIYNLTEKNNVTLILVLYPRLGIDNNNFYGLVMNYTKGKNIIVINDLESVFNTFKQEELIVKGEGHPSPLAHEIFADRIFKELKYIINGTAGK